ncbi:helix-turn-helix domain-containing protein [Caballeronia sordidicola]|uniref:helix-turn-helix domain-containing protein n=1 Tax=Caballeronia sordidicola TaxID=196367 RepID=UPI0004D016E0|nr:helix-turn-helix domain-containing protein [Caballeronia sordidicola]
MSEPQHPTPFGAHKAGQSGSQSGALPGSQPENAASAANTAPGGIQQAASLDSVAAVGVRLTQLREAKNWSLDDVSARLKVSPQKLRALESGDLSLFPDRNFATGIVRSYAKIMGADPAPFTAALRHANGPLEQNLSLPASSGAGLPRGRVSVPLGSSPRRRSWLWGVAAVIVAVIALAMWHTGGDSAAWFARLKASASSATQATNSDTSASSSAAATDEATANTGSVASGDAVTEAQANGAEAQAGTQAAAQAGAQPMPSPLGTNALPASSSTITAVQGAAAHPQSASAPVTAPLANAVKAGAAVTASAVASVGTGANQLELKVASDSWFSVRQKDGKEVFSGLVKAGSVQQVAGDAPFKITVGNRAGLESLMFDGQPVDAAKFGPAKGNVARFSLP